MRRTFRGNDCVSGETTLILPIINCGIGGSTGDEGGFGNTCGVAIIIPVTSCRQGLSRAEDPKNTSYTPSPVKKLRAAEATARPMYDILRRIARRPTGQLSVMIDPSRRR